MTKKDAQEFVEEVAYHVCHAFGGSYSDLDPNDIKRLDELAKKLRKLANA